MASSANQMQAVGYTELGEVGVLRDVSVPKPVAQARDVVVEIKATSTNVIDWKLRKFNLGMPFENKDNKPQIDGYDGAGVVVEVGSECEKGFKVGDEVYFSGLFLRDGTFAQFTAVDERLVALKPTSLSFADAAAFPLVAITGYENLIESMGISNIGLSDSTKTPRGTDRKSILIIGGAGGAGSFAIQLAKHFGAFPIIATASRPDSIAFCKSLGADHVIPHGNFKEDLANIADLNNGLVDNVYVLADEPTIADKVVDVTAPMGCICPIVAFHPSEAAMMKMYLNRVTLSFGMMFCRSLHGLQPEKQGDLLAHVAKMIDAGNIRPIIGKDQVFTGGINADNLKKAMTLQESGKAIGKIVVC